MRTWQSLNSSAPINNSTRMVGFVPFAPGTVVVGTVEKAVMKAPTKGFFMVRIEEPVPVATREDQSDTIAQPGSLVGLRYCHSLRSLATLIGRTFRATFVGTESRDGYVYHRWNIDVAVETLPIKEVA